MKIITIILSFFLFAACGQNPKTKQSNDTKIDSLKLSDSMEPEEQVSLQLIIIPEGLEMKESFDYMEFEESHLEDTIAVGMLGDNNYEVGLLRQLKLDEKWLCIMFPKKDRDAKLEVDTLTTTRHLLNDFPQDYYITLLSVKDSTRNSRILKNGVKEESLLDYNIAFRGDYTLSDFHYYDKKKISKQDSLHITNTIKQALQNGIVKSPGHLPSNSLYLVEMYKLKNNLYVARYKPEQEDDPAGYTKDYSVFLVREDKVLFWDTGDFSIDIEMFSLKGQDYVWVEEFRYAAGFTDLYKLNDSLIRIYNSMFTGD